jgi:hypothetical protein
MYVELQWKTLQVIMVLGENNILKNVMCVKERSGDARKKEGRHIFLSVLRVGCLCVCLKDR